MANYLLPRRRNAADREEQARVMHAWGDWFQQLGDSVVDSGNPVAAWKTISSDGSVADGGGADPVTGYSVIEGRLARRSGREGKGLSTARERRQGRGLRDVPGDVSEAG
jgi:hypothetical protein